MNNLGNQSSAAASAANDWTNALEGASLSMFQGARVATKKRSRTRVGNGELVDITAQLAIMTRSGVDITSALGSLARQCRRPGLKQVLEDVCEAVLGGSTFSGALKKYESVFGPTYVATVAAGEASGEISRALDQLAQLQRSELRLSRTIRSLLAYPVLLASISSLVIVALVLFVLPQFGDVFDQYETPLPFLTQVLLSIANEFRSRWFLYSPLIVLGSIAGIGFRLSPAGKRCWDWLLVHAWPIRDVSRSLLIGRICRLMGLMIESGLPLLDGLRLTRGATKNELFRELLTELERDVLNGKGLALALGESEIVPPAASEMLTTAEKTGSLGEVTRLVGEHFEEEGEAKMRQVVGVLEPMITVGMGLIVAVVVLAVMLPMFDLATFAEQH